MTKVEKFLLEKGIHFDEKKDGTYQFDFTNSIGHNIEYTVSSYSIDSHFAGNRTRRSYDTVRATIIALGKILDNVPESPVPEQIVTVGSSALMRNVK